jgi:hypothetical protein
MYNLNYNVTNARLNRPIGKPFLPSPSYDAYSASLVVAIPGNIFYSGYYNVFGMQFPFSDISAQIRSGIFDYSTNQYQKVGTNVQTNYTGSLGSFGTASLNQFTNNFTSSGYTYSVLMTGSVALNVGTSSLLELSSGSAGAWVAEGWFAFDNTGSYKIIGPPEAEELRDTQPSRPVVWKYKGSTQASSSYVFYAGWTGQNRSTNPYYITTGSIAAFIQPVSSSTFYSEVGIYPIVSSSYKAKQFNHYAYSSEPTANGATYRTYFNGQLVPKILRYKGNWDIIFKKREKGLFTATLFDFKAAQ